MGGVPNHTRTFLETSTNGSCREILEKSNFPWLPPSYFLFVDSKSKRILGILDGRSTKSYQNLPGD